MARKGILFSGTEGGARTPAAATTPPAAATEAPGRAAPRGPVGALQSSLARMQEGALQDIDPALIDDGGFEDRLGQDGAAQRALRDSIATYGQQVPVLLRPHPETRGRYEIVYGRRRLAALRELGLPVRAMVRQLDDHALAMAQGQENTARKDLSFIEKAAFAAQLDAAGYDRPAIAAALTIDLPMVSRMLKVGQAFDMALLRLIGAAPSIGRTRWLALVAMIEKDPAALGRAMLFTRRPDFAVLDSDGRFEAVFDRAAGKHLKAPAPAPEKSTLSTRDGRPLGEMRVDPRAVTLKLTAKDAQGFERWLAENAGALIQELHDRWSEETETPEKEAPPG